MRLPVFALLLALPALAAGQQVIRAEPEVQAASRAMPAPKAAQVAPWRTRHVRLPEGFAPDRAKALPSTDKPGIPMQVGFPRAIGSMQTVRDTRAELAWEAWVDGRTVAAVAVTSPGAAALRLGLHVEALPQGTVLRFHSGNGHDTLEMGAEEIARIPTLPEVWSPVVESDTIVMEVELPPEASPADVSLAAPRVSHLVASPATGFPVAKAASSCNLDAACYQGSWSSESNAVARILFTRDGSTYVCSGTLLADKDTSTAVPYFLTANHCVGTQAAASTVQSYWFYRASACDSGLRGNYRTLTGGATLLYASETTDTALLRLNGTPPAGVTYAGWIVGGTPAIGAPVTGIHHPTGDLQKISFGNIRNYYSCAPGEAGKFSCSTAGSSTSTFYSVGWRQGVTESGSSGSALFLDNGRYLVGQLYGGNGSCTEPGADFYGRFDVAYNAGMSRWLGTTQPTPSAPAITPAFNYTDLWWNPAESGWGLAINQHEDRVFAAWYVYDSSGRPLWVTMSGGQWSSSTRFTGDLWVTSGPDPRFAFDPSQVTRTRVGSATFDFASRDRATLTYTVNGVAGSKSIQRQPFGPFDPRAMTSYGDLWWNANESGWGVSITQQYRSLFVVWYSYLPDRRPVWYVMSDGSWISGDTWQGTLYRTSSGGAFFGAGFDPGAVTRTPVGSMTLRFTSSSTAVMSYSLEGFAGSKLISRQPF